MADRYKIIYLWEDPPFRELFDPDLNPGIDPRTVKCTDKNIQIRYKALDGSISSITPYDISHRKGFSRSWSKYQSEHEYCIDDPLFMEWYTPFSALNPDVDISTLRTDDNNKLINYKDNGEAFQITPYHIIRCLHVDTSRAKRKECRYGDSELKKWLKDFADLNPGIDPDKLTFSDKKTKLYYRPRDSSEICCITPNGLLRKKDWYAPPGGKNTALAKDTPGFIEWFALYKDLNPGVDITTITANSSIRLHYLSQEGAVHSVKVRALCRRKNVFFQPSPPVLCSEDPQFIAWFEEYRWLNPDIDISTLILTTTVKLAYLYEGKRKEITVNRLFHRKDILYQIRLTIHGDPLFWSFCIEEDHRVVDSYRRSNLRVHFKMRCPEGHEYLQTPRQFYHYADLGRSPCPYCDGRERVTEGVNDAASVDPEIKLFYSKDNSKPVHMVSAYNGSSDFKFECPYCGHKFEKRMKNIVGKNPKCPKCKDKGADVPKDKDYMPTGIPFLMIQEDLEPKTRKEI